MQTETGGTQVEFWDIYDKNRQKTGGQIARGQALPDGCYHLAAQAWIRNPHGQWLITRRAPNIGRGLLWEAPGGAVMAGEDSLTGMRRELHEELGLTLSGGTYFCWVRLDPPQWRFSGLLDIWYFEADFPLTDAVLQPEEVCDIRWADEDEILALIAGGQFIPMRDLTYHTELFAAVRRGEL